MSRAPLGSSLCVLLAIAAAACASPADSEGGVVGADALVNEPSPPITIEDGLGQVALQNKTIGDADLVVQAQGRALQVTLFGGDGNPVGMAIGTGTIRLRSIRLDAPRYDLQVRPLDGRRDGSFTIMRQTPTPAVKFELPAYLVGAPAATEGEARDNWATACADWTRTQVGLYAERGLGSPEMFELINGLDCGSPTRIAGRNQFESTGLVRVVADPSSSRPLEESSSTSGDIRPANDEPGALATWMSACLEDIARRRDERRGAFLIASCTARPTKFPQAQGIDFSGPTKMISR